LSNFEFDGATGIERYVINDGYRSKEFADANVISPLIDRRLIN